MKKLSNLFIVLFLFSIVVSGQDTEVPWDKIDEEDNMVVWFRKYENSDVKELKLRFSSSASDLKWISTIQNVETMSDWSYTCKQSELVDSTDINDLYFYFVADIPWPIRGRDVVLHMQAFTDSISGNKILTTKSVTGMVPKNKDLTRVDYMRARWEFIQLPNDSTCIEYMISTEINNSLPDWLIEKAISYSPVKSIDALREIIE